MTEVIQPTVGRVVWFWPGNLAGYRLTVNGNDPLAAIVTAVHDDRCVNLAVFDANGAVVPMSSVELMQPGDPEPSGFYCSWMPYQTGQAQKHTPNVADLIAGLGTRLERLEAAQTALPPTKPKTAWGELPPETNT